jgi:hypothetical protein
MSRKLSVVIRNGAFFLAFIFGDVVYCIRGRFITHIYYLNFMIKGGH